MRPRPAVLMMIAILTAGCRSNTQAAEPPVTETHEWFTASLGDRRIGYMHVLTRPVQRDGRTLLQYVATDHVVVNILGTKMEQTTVAVTLCDQDYRPLESEVTIRSGGRDMAVTARFFPDRIECAKTTAEGTVNKVVPVPDGVQLVADERALVEQGAVTVGKSVDMYQFNPLTLGIDHHVLTGLRQESVNIGGQDIAATLVELKSPYGLAQVWVDGEGRMLKLELPLMQAKLQFVRSTEAEATAAEPADASRVDLVVATAIRPATPIERPRDVERLELRIKGLEVLEAVPTDAGQQVSPDGDARRVVVTAITPESHGDHEELSPADREKYLAATTYIEADHPDMKAAAKEMLGADPPTEPLAIASRIHDAVHERIRWQANIGLFRSALEILHDPAGVCRDTAALFTGLCRAAGVPTRICAGLVYVNGAFMGHAWAESWVGWWQPFDATTASRYVDATHLKLAQGEEYTCVFQMLPALGSLSIEVLDVRHRPADGGR